MIEGPIVVWPPGTFYADCSFVGTSYYDCTYDYPDYAAQHSLVCCPAW